MAKTIQSTLKPHKLSEADAVMTIAIAASLSDGKLQESELIRLRMLAYINPMYDHLADVDDYIASILQQAGTEAWGEKLDHSITALSPSMKETAYAWATEITFCDRIMHTGEHIYLQQLRKRLGIHGSLAGKIRAVTQIRNRCT